MRHTAICVLALALAWVPAPSADPTHTNATTTAPLKAQLPVTPLAAPLIFTGGFGERRIGHFHAGFDLGTGSRVGRPVRAPDGGWIERVRTSGVGYGRSIYLRIPDGRTLQFGHLDAFAGPLAAYVRSAQDASGQYEQDLWPSREQFAVRAGEVIAWSGESGAGGPHLHFEIRRGDVAYNPQQAGLAVPDRVPPTLETLTLEALDDSSLVEGRSGPFTLSLSGATIVRAIGRLRATVVSGDRLRRGASRMTPWSVGIEWEGRRTECRFDSVSWATDMPEAEYVYDTGRVWGSKGLMLWSAGGFRPCVMRADAPTDEEAGTIVIRPGDPPRVLQVRARDLGGGVVTRRVVLRPEAPPARAFPGWWRGEESWSGTSAAFASFPGGFLRVIIPVTSEKRPLDLQFGGMARRATRAAGAWCAVFSVSESAAVKTVRLPLATRPAGSAASPTACGGFVWARRDPSGKGFELAVDRGELRVGFAPGALFEDATVLAYSCASREWNDLVPLGAAWQVEPSRHPLRRPARVRLAAPAGASLDRVGIYRLDPGGWQWIGADRESDGGTLAAESRSLGRFALFHDGVAPRVTLRKPPPPRAGPYSRWAIEASVLEQGSGIDARASWLEVDGVRVATEWDPEAGRLRWRPAKPPVRGTHSIVVVAADHAGNETRTRGEFYVGR